jgi:hypothetical protein
VTEYDPTDPFAVNVAEAWPLGFVVAVTVFLPPANVALAPEVGAVKVTVTPLVADPFVVTVATIGLLNAASMFALCCEPLETAIVSPVDFVPPPELEPHPGKKTSVSHITTRAQA